MNDAVAFHWLTNDGDPKKEGLHIKSIENVRNECIGTDRYYNRYRFFISNPHYVLVEKHDRSETVALRSSKRVSDVIQWLEPKGTREKALQDNLRKVRLYIPNSRDSY